MAIDFKITSPETKENFFNISLDIDKILIGRGVSCDIRLPSPLISYHHATIEMVETSYFVTDRVSKNGSYLNGSRLLAGKRTRLSTGDTLRICGFEIRINLSVPLADAYSAEKTDILEREIFLSSRSRDENESVFFEITEGSDSGRKFKVPSGLKTVTIGTAQDCDFSFNEKRAKKFCMRIDLTPTGWKIDENSVGDARRLVSFPARGKLHDGNEITVGKTSILFHDSIDAALSILKTEKELEASPEVEVVPGEPRPSPGGPFPEKEQPSQERKKEKAEKQRMSRGEAAAGQKEKYAAEYRIAAIAFGIIAFLLSLLLLILVLF